MARFCKACGKPLDKRGHRVLRQGNPLRDRGRVARVPNFGYGSRTKRVYLCRVAPAYTSPETGKVTRTGGYGQRIKSIDTRHVQEDRLDVG
jgi:hypothetical protein